MWCRWTTHHEHVQRHVRLDDGLITPFLRTRIAFPDALSARLLACRAALLQAMEPLDTAIGDIIYLTPANLKAREHIACAHTARAHARAHSLLSLRLPRCGVGTRLR